MQTILLPWKQLSTSYKASESRGSCFAHLLLITSGLLLPQGNVFAQATTYENKAYNYQLVYPAGWVMEAEHTVRPKSLWNIGPASTVVSFSAIENGAKKAELAVIIYPVPALDESTSATALKESTLKDVGRMRNATVNSAEEKEWGNYPGATVDFTFKAAMAKSLKTVPAHWVIWKIRRNDQYYQLRYMTDTAEDAILLSEAKAIMDSFAPLKAESKLAVAAQGNGKDARPAPSNAPLSTPAKIKADGLSPFVGGFAIVKYGNAQGIINRQGTFVVPYNKFTFLDFGLGSLEPEHGFINGGCVARSLTTGRLGIIGPKGEVLIPTDYLLAYPFDSEGWARVTDIKQQNFFINKKGAKISVPACFFVNRGTFFSQKPGGGLADLFTSAAANKIALSGKEYIGEFTHGLSPGGLADGKFSFFNRTGNQIITQHFASAAPFSDGLARVANTNEFGETKYGFIDLKGKLVIPYKFSNKPGNFKNGLAYIEPADKSDFSFAFLTRGGEIVGKQKSAVPLSPSLNGPELNAGYFSMVSKESYNAKVKIIDSTGVQVKNARFLEEVNARIKNAQYASFTDQILIFNYEVRNMQQAVGLVSLRTGQVIYTTHTEIGKFDPVSHLALAADSNGHTQYYVDESGKLVIGVASRSEW